MNQPDWQPSPSGNPNIKVDMANVIKTCKECKHIFKFSNDDTLQLCDDCIENLVQAKIQEDESINMMDNSDRYQDLD